MDKEKTIAESTSDLRQSYHCDLCDKQYTRYSEYDNHLNSYDHHHRQVSQYMYVCRRSTVVTVSLLIKTLHRSFPMFITE